MIYLSITRDAYLHFYIYKKIMNQIIKILFKTEYLLDDDFTLRALNRIYFDAYSMIFVIAYTLNRIYRTHLANLRYALKIISDIS